MGFQWKPLQGCRTEARPSVDTLSRAFLFARSVPWACFAEISLGKDTHRLFGSRGSGSHPHAGLEKSFVDELRTFLSRGGVFLQTTAILRRVSHSSGEKFFPVKT
mmetsp:Transcript_6236/g.10721  ORF Transcript_6236/g.10721 Transcript_6236/m.10721 type:complete len:105 (-) Transcript_6236:315-629(-)